VLALSFVLFKLVEVEFRGKVGKAHAYTPAVGRVATTANVKSYISTSYLFERNTERNIWQSTVMESILNIFLKNDVISSVRKQCALWLGLELRLGFELAEICFRASV